MVCLMWRYDLILWIASLSMFVSDLYKSAIWICVLLANSRVVLTASIPLDVYLCLLVVYIAEH